MLGVRKDYGRLSKLLPKFYFDANLTADNGFALGVPMFAVDIEDSPEQVEQLCL